MADFKAGDQVELKGSGTPMVVKSIQDGSVICVWHDKEDKYHQQAFPIEVLEYFNSSTGVE